MPTQPKPWQEPLPKKALWTLSTCLTHQTIVGRCKISDKTETKAIFKPIQEEPNGQKHIKIETIRKPLDLIWLVSMKAQQLLEGLNRKFGFFQNLFLIWLGRTIGNRCDMENYFLLLRLTHQIFYPKGITKGIKLIQHWKIMDQIDTIERIGTKLTYSVKDKVQLYSLPLYFLN